MPTVAGNIPLRTTGLDLGRPLGISGSIYASYNMEVNADIRVERGRDGFQSCIKVKTDRSC